MSEGSGGEGKLKSTTEISRKYPSSSRPSKNLKDSEFFVLRHYGTVERSMFSKFLRN